MSSCAATIFGSINRIGFDLQGKTVGIVGCGRIGGMLAGILHGFGCRLLEFNVQPNEELTRRYDMTCVPLEQLCAEADIISIHASLNEHTHYLFDAAALVRLKPGAMLLILVAGSCLIPKPRWPPSIQGTWAV